MMGIGGADIQMFGAGIMIQDNFSTGLLAFNSLLSAGMGILTAFTGLVVGAGVAVGVLAGGLAIAATKTSTEFSQSIANANSVMQLQGDEFVKLTDLAREYGRDTAFTATQVADAFYTLGSAGVSTVEEIEQLSLSMIELADATQYGFQPTAEVMLSTMQAMNIDFEKAGYVADVFANAVKNSPINMERLTTSMSYVAPIASTMNESLDTVVGTLAILHTAGVKGGKAGTGLRRMFISLVKPSMQAQEALASYGLSIDDVNPATNDFVDVLDKLISANISATDAAKIFGARGITAFGALKNAGIPALESMIASMNESGTATEMYNIQMDTLSGQLRILKSSYDEVLLSIGMPWQDFLKNSVKGIIEIVNAISKWENETHKISDFLGSIGDAILVFLIGTTDLKGSIENAGGAFNFLSNEMSGALGWIRDNAQSFIDFWNNDLPSITKTTRTVFSYIPIIWNTYIVPIWNWASENIPILINNFRELWIGIVSTADSALSILVDVWNAYIVPIWNWVKDNARTIITGFVVVWNAIASIVGTVLGHIHEGWNNFWASLGSGEQTALEVISSILKQGLQVFINIFKVGLGIIITVIDFAMKIIGPLLTGDLRNIGDAFAAFLLFLSGDWKTAFSLIINITKRKLGTVLLLIANGLDFLVNTTPEPLIKFVGFFTNMFDSVKLIANSLGELFNKIVMSTELTFGAIKDLASFDPIGAAEKLANLDEVLKDTFGGIPEDFLTSLNEIWSKAPTNFMEGLIGNQISGLKDIAQNIFEDLGEEDLFEGVGFKSAFDLDVDEILDSLNKIGQGIPGGETGIFAGIDTEIGVDVTMTGLSKEDILDTLNKMQEGAEQTEAGFDKLGLSALDVDKILSRLESPELTTPKLDIDSSAALNKINNLNKEISTIPDGKTFTLTVGQQAAIESQRRSELGIERGQERVHESRERDRQERLMKEEREHEKKLIELQNKQNKQNSKSQSIILEKILTTLQELNFKCTLSGDLELDLDLIYDNLAKRAESENMELCCDATA